MIPGPGTIFSLLPKVQLALKMKRSPLLEYWFYKKAIGMTKSTIIHNMSNNMYALQAHPAIDDFFEMYSILSNRKYTKEEVAIGVKSTANFTSKIRSEREYRLIHGSTNKNKKRTAKFLENKILPKIKEVFEKREIPLFSRKTNGELRYNEKVITEAQMEVYANTHSDYHISAFKFKDKNGRMSLNFFGCPTIRRSIRRSGKW